VIGFKIDKSMFFDRPKVVNATNRATRRVLSRFGAYVRQTARHSIRRRKRSSAPGQPPSSHVGLLRRRIYFGYDPRKESVVIGPTPINASGGRSPYGSTTVPELLEEGGRVQRKGRDGKTETLNYQARPFMGPAFEKEKPKLPAMWKDSVKP